MCKHMAAVIESFMEQMIYFALYNSKLRLQIDKCAWLGGHLGSSHTCLIHSLIYFYTPQTVSRDCSWRNILTRPCGIWQYILSGIGQSNNQQPIRFNVFFLPYISILDDGDVKALLPSDDNVQYHGKPISHAISLVAFIKQLYHSMHESSQCTKHKGW